MHRTALLGLLLLAACGAGSVPGPAPLAAGREWTFTPTGARRWRLKKVAQTYSSPGITDDGIVYFGDHKAYLTGLDIRTEHLLGRYRGPSDQKKGGPTVGICTSPVIDTGATVDSYPALGADGLLPVGVTDGRLPGFGR